MILSTTHTVPGREIGEILGIARGSTVRARHIGRDIVAGLKNIVGGEIEEYNQLQAEAREQSLQRMIDDAQRLNADAIVGINITTAMVSKGAAEILAFGTAVKLL
ncbi:MAG: YbjQ family protein [Bacteroidota bacterium]